MTTGRAPWLPNAFMQAMHLARVAIHEERLEQIRRERKKLEQRGPVPVTGRGARGGY